MRSSRDVAEGEYRVELDTIASVRCYVFVSTNGEWFGTWTLSTRNPKTDKLQITRSEVTALYDTIIESCNYVFDREEMATIMEKTIGLARSVQLTNAMLPDCFIREDMGALVAGKCAKCLTSCLTAYFLATGVECGWGPRPETII